MIDPTEINKSKISKDKESSKKHFLKTFLTGLLGGVLGCLPFIAVKIIWEINIFELMIISGIGVVAIYMYFIEKNERNNKQIPFLFLASFVSMLVGVLAFIIVDIWKNPDYVLSVQNVIDAYISNTEISTTEISTITFTLYYHLICEFFSALGVGLAILYLKISVPRYEKKHGTPTDGTGYMSRKKREKRK